MTDLRKMVHNFVHRDTPQLKFLAMDLRFRASSGKAWSSNVTRSGINQTAQKKAYRTIAMLYWLHFISSTKEQFLQKVILGCPSKPLLI